MEKMKTTSRSFVHRKWPNDCLEIFFFRQSEKENHSWGEEFKCEMLTDIHQTAVINWWQRSDDLWPCDRGHRNWLLVLNFQKKDGEDEELYNVTCLMSLCQLLTTNYVQSPLRFLSFLTSNIKVFVSSTVCTCNLIIFSL